MSYDAYKNKNLSFTTRQLHAGYNPADHHYAKNVPIYQTGAFEFGDFDRCVRYNNHVEPDAFSYSRVTNPTDHVLEERMASLDGGVAAVAFASGMAAITSTLINLANKGDEIISVLTMYGESVELLEGLLPDYGIVGKFVENPDDPKEFEALITDKTKAIYIESLGNPLINIVDLEEVAKIAHAHGVPVVVDNTFATPYLFRPFEHGADITIYSATKYLGGHGTTVGGIVVEKGDFDWHNGRFPQLDKFYENNKAKYPNGELETILFTKRLIARSLSYFGAHMAPINAFLIIQGIETLSLRMERHASNAQKIAEFLDSHPAVKQVDFPGLKGNKYHELAKKYFPNGLTGMMSFRINGGKEAAIKLLNNVHLFDQMVNVGDSKSLIVYPTVATHFAMTEEERNKAGIFEDTIRVSVGIEDVDDLIADLKNALDSI